MTTVPRIPPPAKAPDSLPVPAAPPVRPRPRGAPAPGPLRTVLALTALALPATAQVHVQQLTASGGVVCEQFGHGLAMDGSRLVVGAAAAPDDPTTQCASGPGSAYVFELIEDGWVQTQRLVPSDGEEQDEFGNSVDVWGDTIVVGAELQDSPLGKDTGSAYVFEIQGATWIEVAKLTPSDPEPLQSFARSVAVCGDWIVCGARLDSKLGLLHAGAAYVFRRGPGGAWTQTQKLYASDPASSALFGNSASIDGETFVIGAYWAFGPEGYREGAAYVFELAEERWEQTQKLGPLPSAPNKQFGRSVSIHGDQLVVGARTDGGPGAAYAFERLDGWHQTGKLTPPGGGAQGDQFGESVAVWGNHAVVGARLASGLEGRAYLFQRLGSDWSDCGELVHAVPGQGWFGYNVAISAWAAAVGAPFDRDARGSVGLFSFPPGVSYCTAGTSASGCQAALITAGVPSASMPSGFELGSTGVEGARDGLIFFSTNGCQASPWGSGTSFQCVAPPVTRCGPLTGVGTPGSCDGRFRQDLNAHWCASGPNPHKNPGAGAVVQAQLWYRDPLNTSNQTTSLSDAVEFTVDP